MSRIKKVYYLDKKHLQSTVSSVNNCDSCFRFRFNPLIFIHHLLPLKMKFLPESYILQEENKLIGFITVTPSRCPLKQMEIHKLLYEESNLSYVSEMVQYVVSRYKAMGTLSFVVRIDDYLPELIKLFITKCGFSQISYEKLWKINYANKREYDKNLFRHFRNNDAPAAASLYNESLLPHFRPLLGKDNREFREILCKGLSYCTEYKYVIENKQSGNIDAYLSIQTIDNENYILDLVHSCWTEIDIDKVITFAYFQIMKRNKKFNLFFKTKKYMQYGEAEEQNFLKSKHELVRNSIILTNTSAGIIKDTQSIEKFTVLDKFYSGVGANTTCCR